MKTFAGFLLGILTTLSVQFLFPDYTTIPKGDCPAQDSTQVAPVDSTVKEISPAVTVDSFPATADSVK